MSRGAWYFRPNAVEEAVDEPAGVFGAELFCEFYGFVDCDYGRHFRVVQEFKNCEPQDVSIDGGESGELVVFGELDDEFIELSSVRADALDEGLRKGARLRRDGAAHRHWVECVGVFRGVSQLPEIGVGGGFLQGLEVELEKVLDGCLSSFSAETCLGPVPFGIDGRVTHEREEV